jgi:hypothetical protein
MIGIAVFIVILALKYCLKNLKKRHYEHFEDEDGTSNVNDQHSHDYVLGSVKK